MKRFRVLIAPFILVLTIVFILSLIGVPRPSFEKVINKKPSILPSDAEVLEYNQEEQWEIKLDDELSSVEDLVVKAINVNDFKSYKKSKSPVKIKRKDEKIIVKRRKDADEKVSDVIVAIAKPRSEERVSWKKSYLVHLKPKTIFVNSEKTRKQVNSLKVKGTETQVATSEEQEDVGVYSASESEEFIFGKPKPSPSPVDECSFDIYGNPVDGVESDITVYYPEGSKVLSASISNVKPTNRKPINVSRSTRMSFTKKIDSDSSIIFFTTKNAKWYGVDRGTKRDHLCHFHLDQSEYEALIKVRVRKSDGKICNLNEKYTFVVDTSYIDGAAHLEAEINSRNAPVKIVQNTSRRCCVEIQPQPSPIIAKRVKITNSMVGQYRAMIQKEEERHAKQYMGGLSWREGGNGDEPNNKRVYSKLSRVKHCASKRFFSKGGSSNLCTRATGYARNALRRATNRAAEEFAQWSHSEETRCWREYTAKRFLRFNHFIDYPCSHASKNLYPNERGGYCPLRISQPAYLPPVSEAVSLLNKESK